MMYKPIYFKESEFARCSPSCKMSDCDEEALKRLDAMRDYCAMPIKLNCAYRSPEYDKARNRTGDSAHCKGKAFDIAVKNGNDRFKYIEAALACGFNRIGVAGHFLHIDCDYSKPVSVWLY